MHTQYQTPNFTTSSIHPFGGRRLNGILNNYNNNNKSNAIVRMEEAQWEVTQWPTGGTQAKNNA